MAAEGRYMDALKLIKKENPFPTVCGHICNRRCEQACTRGSVDRAVAIDEIKKFIAEQELHADKRYVPKMLNQRNIPFTEKIAVIGGGNVSIDVARAALRLGAEKVYLVYHRGESELKADRDEIEDALAEGMELKLLRAPSEIVGKNGKVSAIRLEIMELGETDASGRRAPVGTGEYETWNVNTVIGAIGQRVDWGALLDGENVELRKNGTAVCDGLTLQTAQPDIFVGGDVATGPKFAIGAIAAGKEAAISLHHYVHEGQSLTIGRNRRSYPELDKRNVALPTECFDAPARQVPAALPGAQARKTFRDSRCTFTEEQVKMEASRCLGCGVSVVDTNRCIGCGVCTTKCEFDAIHLRRDHPEATKMIRSEDKMKAILPYMIKRAAKIKVKELRSKHS